uniref:Protein kinase domain-containing protein n=1 Tax=Steinernema glaseri TaxID=37863 RepID=A0A1I7YD99_9BILA
MMLNNFPTIGRSAAVLKLIDYGLKVVKGTPKIQQASRIRCYTKHKVECSRPVVKRCRLSHSPGSRKSSTATMKTEQPARRRSPRRDSSRRHGSRTCYSSRGRSRSRSPLRVRPALLKMVEARTDEDRRKIFEAILARPGLADLVDHALATVAACTR